MGASRVSEDHEDLTRVPLQAILLTDSFDTKFRPITLERPKWLRVTSEEGDEEQEEA